MKFIRKLPLIVALLAILLSFPTPSVFAEELAINNVQIKNVGYTSATIAWFTNMPANSQVSYGKVSLDENTSPSSNTFTDNHSITITNLKPATQYKFQVTSTNQQGITTASQELTFSTLSFTFDDSASVGNFSSLNASPTPTPIATNPSVYGQTTYPQTNPYVQGTYQTQQPVYIIPPVIYQQPQGNGSTLGAQDIQSPTPIIIQSSNDSTLAGIFQSSILGIVGLSTILMVIMGGFFFMFFRNRSEIDSLKQLIVTTDNTTSQVRQARKIDDNQIAPQNQPAKSDKTYSFDVT